MSISWIKRYRIIIATAVALVGCTVFAVLHITSRPKTDSQSPPVYSITLKNPQKIMFEENEHHFVTRIGSPQASNIAYAAVDYQSGPSRRFRRSLDDLQQAFGGDFAIIILPDAASDQGKEIHRTLLALRRADPRIHSQVESRLLNERLKATPSEVIDTAARLVGTDRFHAVYRFHKEKIDALLDRTATAVEANRQDGRGMFPALFAGDHVLFGFDGNPVRLEEFISNSFSIKRLSELPYRPEMHLTNETIDLGLIPANGKSPITIAFENTGNEALSIGLVKAGPGARVISLPDTPINPGEGDQITLALDPQRCGGSIDRDILIGSNDGTGFRTVRLRGQVAPNNAQTASR